jgi:predicted dehydrogenase
MTYTDEITRRRLITTAGAGILAAGALGVTAGRVEAQGGGQQQQPQPAQPQAAPPGAGPGDPPMPPDRRVGIAIVGIGDFATHQIIPSFPECKMAKLAGFVTGAPAKGRQFAERFGVDPKNVFTYDQMARLADVPEIEAVYVITPNAIHKQNVLAAVKAGKHVLCEKPMSTNSRDCREMIEACRAANRKLMIAYRAQYEPYNQTAVRLCRDGKLGKIVSVTSDHGRIADPSKPQDRWRLDKELAGGGSLPDIGIYSLQAARYLTGEEPVEISAHLEQPKDDPRFKEVEATVHWTMRFPSGALANCSSSYNWQSVKRAQVFGSEASLTLDPATDYYRHELTVQKNGLTDDAPVIENHKIQEKNQFALEIDHFADCVRNDKQPKTPGEEGLRDVFYIEKIYEAARTGRPVKVSDPTRA